MANSVGIVDNGYRGDILGLFDVESMISKYEEKKIDYLAKPYEKLVQICVPNLVPIYVELVNLKKTLKNTKEKGTKRIWTT